jgi:hypothetical protein
MPRLSRIMIRTALLWLGLGYTAGGLALASKGLALPPWIWALRSSHVHLLLFGWTIQLACGVAFWILPRLTSAGDRGDARFVWATYLSLNAGVVLAALYGPLGAIWGDTQRLGWMLALAGVLYMVAALGFVTHAWRRVLPFRTLPRPEKGER